MDTTQEPTLTAMLVNLLGRIEAGPTPLALADAQERHRGELQAPTLMGPCESPWHMERALELDGLCGDLAYLSGIRGNEHMIHAYVTARNELRALCGVYVTDAELRAGVERLDGCAVAGPALAERLTGLSIHELRAGDSPDWGPWEVIEHDGGRYIMGYVVIGIETLHCCWRIEWN